MIEFFNKLSLYFEFPFVRYAFIVGLAIAICSAMLGVILVLKRFSYIGDGLSHVAFGSMAIAIVLSISNNMFIILPVTIAVAILLICFGNRKNKGDSVISMLSVGALAMGYLLLNVFSKSSNLAGDVCSTFFGSTSILTLKKSDVILCLVLTAIVIAIFVLLYNKFFVVTFDENYAKATGINAGLYNFIIAIVTAIVIVLAMNLVGSLLISALIVFPAVSAMKITKSFKGVLIYSTCFSVICTAAGLLISIGFGTPVGSTIVATDILGFIISTLIGIGRK